MTRAVVGVDGGGTKTLCVVLGESGNELGRGSGGPGNHHNVGFERTGQSLREATASALAAAGLSWSAVGAICLGMAGADLPQDVKRLYELARCIADVHHIKVCGDAETALVGGIGQPLGVVVIAGTGSIAFGINHRGERRRAGGWGHVFGDEGSAHYIGTSALRAVLQAFDGREPPTALTEALEIHWQIPSPQGLLERLLLSDPDVVEIAGLAPLVSRVANAGDAMAQSILAQAGRELGRIAAAVIHGLDMQRDTFELVMVGGTFQAGEWITGSFRQAVHAVAPGAELITPRHDPATGAAFLALQTLRAG